MRLFRSGRLSERPGLRQHAVVRPGWRQFVQADRQQSRLGRWLTSKYLPAGAALLAVLAITAGYVLGWADRAFYVEIDPKVEAILEALPGANCGGCGFVGCAEYAEAVAKGEADVTRCAPSCPKAMLPGSNRINTNIQMCLMAPAG